MKNKIFVTFLGIILLGGCSTLTNYVQVFRTEAVNLKNKGNIYTYENDTIRVDYTFWCENGLMGFRIYNKTDRLLYIDWKKSFCVFNGAQVNYYENKTVIKSYWVENASSIFNAFSIVSGYSNSRGDGTLRNTMSGNTNKSGSSNTTVYTPERISIIAPRNYIDRYTCHLISNYFKDWKVGFTQTKEPLFDGSRQNTTIFAKNFQQANSPLNFSNYITFSFKEDFVVEYPVRNEFYVKEILAMDFRHFFLYKFDFHDNKEKGAGESDKYKRGTDFYIKTY